MKPPIDWPAVERAMRRCKYGQPAPGDTELCAQAHRQQPTEYAERKRRIDQAVTEEMRRFGGGR